MNEAEFREMILDSSSPYLIARKGMWINANRDEIFLADMDQEYKENCYYLMLKEWRNIDSGSFLSGFTFDGNDYNEIMNRVRVLYMAKLCELKAELPKGE